MDSMPSVWTSDLESEAELQHRLLLATLELEALQNSVKEERWRSEENINQLIQILKVITQERDEAREQLHALLNKIAHLQPDSPQIWPARGCSRVVGSESLHETTNHHPHGSSPVEPFFETDTSPELTSMNGADSCAMRLPQQPLFLENNNHSFSVAKYDRGDAIIESISSKKPLPEKGKLLETLLKIGPMLETLMVAGPLPRWRNPPLLQSFQLSPVTVEAPRHAQLLNRVAILSSNHLIRSSPDEKSNGLSQIHATSMLL